VRFLGVQEAPTGDLTVRATAFDFVVKPPLRPKMMRRRPSTAPLDHPAPAVESLRGRKMVAIEGGTQALRRTVNARLEIIPGTVTTISVPRPFGGVVLNAAAYLTDSRDRDRHPHDVAALPACIEDPFIEREAVTGPHRRRLLRLADALPQSHPPRGARPLPTRPLGG
jgi:hypothetical protein